jgi:hypothetical protein
MNIRTAKYVSYDELSSGFNAFSEYFYKVIEDLGINETHGEESNLNLVKSELVYQFLWDLEEDGLIGENEQGRITMMERIKELPEDSYVDF